MENIRTIPLYHELDEATAERVSRQCSWKSYEENALIIDYEDETTDVRFIMSGRVRIILRVSTGKEMILAEMKEGDYFGEIAAIDGSGRSANVTALQRSHVCVMPRGIFLELQQKYPSVNTAILRNFAARIRSLNTRLAEHSFLQSKHRLCCELLRLSRPRPGRADQRSISPPPTQKDIAARIGSRREVVSREIASLKRAGVLEKTTGALIINDVGAINRRISEGWDACQ